MKWVEVESTAPRANPERARSWALKVTSALEFATQVGVRQSGSPLRINVNNGLSPDPLGPVKGGNGIVEDSHIADVCTQPTIPEPMDNLVQLGAIGFDDE